MTRAESVALCKCMNADDVCPHRRPDGSRICEAREVPQDDDNCHWTQREVELERRAGTHIVRTSGSFGRIIQLWNDNMLMDTYCSWNGDDLPAWLQGVVLDNLPEDQFVTFRPE